MGDERKVRKEKFLTALTNERREGGNWLTVGVENELGSSYSRERLRK